MTMTAIRDVMMQVCVVDPDPLNREDCPYLPGAYVSFTPTIRPAAVVRLSLYPCPRGGTMELTNVPANVPLFAVPRQGYNISIRGWRQVYSTCGTTSGGQPVTLDGQLALDGMYWAAEWEHQPNLQLSGNAAIAPIGATELAGHVGGDLSFNGTVGGHPIRTGTFSTSPAPPPATPAPTPTPPPTTPPPTTPAPAPGPLNGSPNPLDFGTVIQNTACGPGPNRLTGTIRLTAPSDMNWTVSIPGRANPADYDDHSIEFSPASGRGSQNVTVTLSIRQVFLTTGCHLRSPTRRTAFFLGSGGALTTVDITYVVAR